MPESVPPDPISRLQPTDDARDCRICDFASVCRVKFDDYGRAESPLAEWSKDVGMELADAESFRILRRVDG